MNNTNRFSEIVDLAMQMQGAELPTTIEAVEQLQSEIESEPYELPKSLQSIDVVLDLIQQPKPNRARDAKESTNAATAGLRSLAARFGGELSNEVLHQMQLDRENAEREFNRRSQENPVREAE